MNGNESPYAAVGPTQTAGAGDASGAFAFALAAIAPMPVRGAALGAGFTLSDDAPVQLELIDIAGRKVVQRTVHGAGAHAVRFGQERALAAGVYLVRLSRGADVRVQRAVVVQ